MIMGSEKRASSELCVGDLSIGFVELPVTGNWQHAATYRATSQKKIQRTTLQKGLTHFGNLLPRFLASPSVTTMNNIGI